MHLIILRTVATIHPVPIVQEFIPSMPDQHNLQFYSLTATALVHIGIHSQIKETKTRRTIPLPSPTITLTQKRHPVSERLANNPPQQFFENRTGYKTHRTSIFPHRGKQCKINYQIGNCSHLFASL